ncbi:MAG: hypothetical protein CL693_09465 [Cellvibrionaceae bacterium]|nr:hypothetical protein [Cellvibrionaceae bacterium]|tara:strand:+ start:720 stop:2072 length:1353 start_codon:yes stop_codon:yes gene_type:complete
MSFRNSYAEAVFIFSGKDVVREMHFSEFEAVLEGFVPLAEQAAQSVHAVYLRVGTGCRVTAAVFFLIEFDKAGFADRRWNVPLEQLAETSAEGPDLGAGPIRLACRSQCAIAWHQQQLWDPQMSPQCNHFAAIKRSIEKNALHLVVPDDIPTLSAEPAVKTLDEPQAIAQSNKKAMADLDAQWRARVAQTIKEARLRVSTLKQQSQQQIDDLKDQLRRQSESSKREQLKLESELQLQIDKVSEHSHVIDGQEQKLKGLREYFEHKLTNLKSVDTVSVDTIRQHLQADFEAELTELKKSYEEKLQMRDVEVMYRDTQLAGLTEEIDKLRAEKQALLESSGNNLLEQIQRSGISFVSFQPGAGHMTIPVEDVARFMNDSAAYTAEKCRVDVGVFRRWRRHYQDPVCVREIAGGTICGKLLTRVDRPADFVEGSSDCCNEHQTADSPLAQVLS